MRVEIHFISGSIIVNLSACQTGHRSLVHQPPVRGGEVAGGGGVVGGGGGVVVVVVDGGGGGCWW